MSLKFNPLDQAFVDAIRAGGPDANGQPAEHAMSTGPGNPCRSCLRIIPEGAPMLILAACPFPKPQPYAETGPVFLCGDACAPYDGTQMPEVLAESPDYLLKGYSADHRIVYGTGAIVAVDDVASYSDQLLSRDDIAHVDVRSVRNNCFLTRITRS